MPHVFNIAPRVVVYPHGTLPPAVEEGWLALPQLPTSAAVVTAARNVASPSPASPGSVAPSSPASPGSVAPSSPASPGSVAPSSGASPGSWAPRSADAGAAPARLSSVPALGQPAGSVAAISAMSARSNAGGGARSERSRAALDSAPPRRAVFGDGSHPTTRLCAAAVDLLCRQRPGMAVLDVGTGTGILARIARARGAAFVAGTDIDPAALACAKAHAHLDSRSLRARCLTDDAAFVAPRVLAATDPRMDSAAGCAAAANAGMDSAAERAAAANAGMDLAGERAAAANASMDLAGERAAAANAGMDSTAEPAAAANAGMDLAGKRAAAANASVDLTGERAAANARHINIHFSDEAPDHWGARFDLVIANILEAPLHTLAPALCRALVPGGVLVISGFTRPQLPALRHTYEAAGLRSAGDFSLEEWVLLKFVAPIQADHNFSR